MNPSLLRWWQGQSASKLHPSLYRLLKHIPFSLQGQEHQKRWIPQRRRRGFSASVLRCCRRLSYCEGREGMCRRVLLRLAVGGLAGSFSLRSY